MNSIQMPTCSSSPFGAVDGDHVWVADAGKMARFLQRRPERHLQQDLQRDFTIELRVPRPVDSAEGTLADGLEQHERTPHAGRGDRVGRRCRFGRLVSKRTMRIDHAREPAKLRDHLFGFGCGAGRHDALPVDASAIGDIVRETDEPGFFGVVSHGASDPASRSRARPTATRVVPIEDLPARAVISE